MTAMSLPLVSIVLPTYNGSRYLSISISSCVDQTYKNWELIIVDDASSDNTPDLIAGYLKADPRIRTVLHHTNRKLPAALNTGFSQARGEYLTWTSDDNFYDRTAISVMVDRLERCPEVDLVYADYYAIDEHGHVVAEATVHSPIELLHWNCIGPCFLYRRRVGEGVGRYAEDLYLAEDYDFWLRVSARFQIQPLHKKLYYYRGHGASLTSMHQEAIRIAHEKAQGRNLPNLGWADRKRRSDLYQRLIDRASGRKDYRHVRRLLLDSMRLAPAIFFTRTVPKLLLGNRYDSLKETSLGAKFSASFGSQDHPGSC
jgi:glycosyltransferase involved in cell wall biosynthesis